MEPILEDSENNETAKCKGCSKIINKKSLLRHVGMSRSCKTSYGDTYFEMLNRSKKITQKKCYAKQRDKKVEYQRKYNEKQDVDRWIKAEDPTKCNGCSKTVEKKSLLRHVGMKPSCKAAYGERYHEMVLESRKKSVNDYNNKNKEDIAVAQWFYDMRNKSKIKQI